MCLVKNIYAVLKRILRRYKHFFDHILYISFTAVCTDVYLFYAKCTYTELCSYQLVIHVFTALAYATCTAVLSVFTMYGLSYQTAYTCLTSTSDSSKKIRMSNLSCFQCVFNCPDDMLLTSNFVKRTWTVCSIQCFISHFQSPKKIIHKLKASMKNYPLRVSWFMTMPPSTSLLSAAALP